MTNILDYVVWRGDLPLDRFPFNEIDALAMACLSYLEFQSMSDGKGWTLAEAKRLDLLINNPTSSSFAKRRALFELMAVSERYKDCRMRHYISATDESMEMQFSAMCIDLTDGTTCVAFRGTDNTIIGWREDFNMSYLTSVPGQQAARYYLDKVAELHDRPLRVVGHSKGGNLGVYACLNSNPSTRDQIESIWNFDGPGMNDELAAMPEYPGVKKLIRSFVPQTSIIGMLMNYYEPYTVVHSDASGIAQHDPFSWEIRGVSFVTEEKIDHTAEVVSKTLHEWLENSTEEQRGQFVDTLFQLVEETKATRMSELLNEKWKSVTTMVGATRDVDPETRRAFNRLIAQFVALGAGNTWDRVKDTQFVNSAENVWDKVKEASIATGGNLLGKFRNVIDGFGSKEDQKKEETDTKEE